MKTPNQTILDTVACHDGQILRFEAARQDRRLIETRYVGPTNTRGSRIIATDSDGNRVTVSYPYELSGEAVHRKAAEALRDKMGWTGRLIAGGTKRGYCFIFAGD